MNRTTLPMLAVLASGLALTLGLELYGGALDRIAAPRAATQAAPQPVTSPAATATADPGEEWVKILLTRPLFDPQRRPEPGKGDAAASQAAPGLPRLAGTVVGPEGQVAIFMAGNAAKPVVASKGTRLGAYLVRSVQPGRVTIEGPDGPRVLHPIYENMPSGALRGAGLPTAGVPVLTDRHSAAQVPSRSQRRTTQ